MWGKRNTGTNNNALMTATQASATSHHRNMDSLHGQLGQLLNDAQALLADIAPGASGSQFGYQQFNGGAVHSGWTGKPSGMQSMLTSQHPPIYSIVAMQAEVRTLEFWRSIIGECAATFFYVLIVCSVATTTMVYQEGKMVMDPGTTTYCALSAGLAIAIITAAFSGVSGAHANPAVTMAMIIVRQISPLRAILYMCAQCGGGIAGAALVNGVYSTTGIRDPILLEDPQRGAFGMEFTLTFMVVYVICAAKADAASNAPSKPPMQPSSNYGSSAYYNSANAPPMIGVTSNKPNPIIVGAAYAGCLISWLGSLNPARALGSAFVSDLDYRFKMHWIFWVGPFLGAITGAFSFEYIFNPFRRRGGFSPFASGTNPSGFGSATATTTTIINTGGGTTGLLTSSSAGALTANHNTNQMYMGRSEFGNETDRAIGHNLDTDIDMLDDLERSKQYKTNIMQDFSDRQSGYPPRNQYNQQPYKGSMSVRGNDMYDTYGGTSKSMYNQPMGGGYDSRDMRSGYYDGTKSMYNGYDGGSDYMRGGGGGSADVRRSRSVNNRQGIDNRQLPTRRNPYDYLPDEPQTMLPPNGASSSMHAGPSNVVGGTTNPILSNKPDIMQSVGMDGTATGNRAITGKGTINSPSGRGYGVSQHGGYGNEKMDQRNTYQDHYRDTAGYRDRDMTSRGGMKSTNEILGGVGTNPGNTTNEELMYDASNPNYPAKRRMPNNMGAVGGVSTNETSDGLAATSGYGTREQQANQRMAHLQSSGRMTRPAGAADDYGRTGYAGSGTGTGSVAAGPSAMGQAR